MFQADGREFLDADDQVTFVHCRHEGLANLGVNQPGRQQHDSRDRCNNTLPLQAPNKRWFIELQELAWQPRVFVFDFAQQVRRQHGNDGQRQHQRAGQGKNDGQRHRHKVLAFQALQREQWQEDGDDDQNPGGDRNRYFTHRPVNGVQTRQFAGGGVGRKALHNVFHDDHGCINQHADGNGQATQAHQVGRHAKGAHQDERDQCRQRKHQRHR
ncbi:hypothetical protein D9M73_136050 [compost metagenome]